MEAWFDSGQMVRLVLAVLTLEALLLSGLAWLWRGRIPLVGLLLNLAAGACLLLALRSVLHEADWRIVGGWLGAAFVAHLGDLLLRLRREKNAIDS